MNYDNVPTHEELRNILSFVDNSDYDTWYKTFIACGRTYPNDPTAFSICQNWASSYGKRDAQTAKQEQNAFYKSSNTRSGVGIGWLINRAKTGGYKPPHKEWKDKDFQPFNVTIKDNTAVTITEAIEEAKQGNHENGLLHTASLQIMNGIHRVLDFWVFKSALYDADRIKFLSDCSNSFNLVPYPARRYLKALSDYCTLTSQEPFNESKFIEWGELNIKGFNGNELNDLCNVDFDSDKFTEISSPAEAKKYFDTATTQAWHLLIIKQCEELKDLATLNCVRRDLDDAKQSTKSKITELLASNSIIDQKVVTLRGGANIVAEAKKEILYKVDPSKAGEMYIETGYEAIDKKIRGIRREGTSIIAAHSGVGKTWLGVDLCRKMLERNARVVFFSSEMGGGEIAARLVQNYCDIGDGDLKMYFERDQLATNLKDKANLAGYNTTSFNSVFERAESFLNSHGQMIISCSNIGDLSVEQMSAQLAALTQEGPIDLVVVDYLQNIRAESLEGQYNLPRHLEVQTVMRAITKMSKEFKVPTVVLAQLNNPNRKPNGANSQPNQYDIADSTSVVRDTTSVIALYHTVEEKTFDTSGVTTEFGGKPVQATMKTNAVQLNAVVVKTRLAGQNAGSVNRPMVVHRSAGSRFTFLE